ncbi:putative polyamine transporter [Panicum miliaceum]|uniref:Polyamine transporter n=1 Tax=Panicum miliaceum TaxID=4540 RepID=A0A3L6TK46_PANMI|nr:putative polyamine transporter [Panicum miliaceum]
MMKVGAVLSSVGLYSRPSAMQVVQNDAHLMAADARNTSCFCRSSWRSRSRSPPPSCPWRYMPGTGGYIVWVDRAFRPFAGSLMGMWKYVCGAFKAAAFFTALCSDYLTPVAPAVSRGSARVAEIITFNPALSFLSYTGLGVVGWSAVAPARHSPFLVMSVRPPGSPCPGSCRAGGARRDHQRQGLKALPEQAGERKKRQRKGRQA